MAAVFGIVLLAGLLRPDGGAGGIAALSVGDPVAVSALVDGLVPHAEILTLKGDGYRLKGKKKG